MWHEATDDVIYWTHRSILSAFGFPYMLSLQYSTTEDWEHTRLKLCNHSSGLPMIISSKLFSFSNPYVVWNRLQGIK